MIDSRPSQQQTQNVSSNNELDSRRSVARDALLGSNNAHQPTPPTRVEETLTSEDHKRAQSALSKTDNAPGLMRRRPRRGSRGSKRKKKQRLRNLALASVWGHDALPRPRKKLPAGVIPTEEALQKPTQPAPPQAERESVTEQGAQNTPPNIEQAPQTKPSPQPHIPPRQPESAPQQPTPAQQSPRPKSVMPEVTPQEPVRPQQTPYKPTPFENRERTAHTTLQDSKAHWGKQLIVVTTVIVLALGGGAGFGVGYYYYKTGSFGSLSLPSLSFFSSDSEDDTSPEPVDTTPTTQIDIARHTPEQIVDFIAEQRSRSFEPNTLTPLTVLQNETKPTARAFLETFNVNATDEFLRSLGTNFILGVYANDQKKHTYLALEVTNYARGFAGMLAWEEEIRNDLGTLFHENVPLSRESFQDDAIGTIDVRFLPDSFGEPIITYAFVSNTGLIITDTPTTLRHILEIYRTQRRTPTEN